jgi:putative ABC transport system permease protein
VSRLPVPLRLLLGLFPADFRALHAEGLARDYASRVEGAGFARRAALWAAVGVELVATLAGVWWDRWTTRASTDDPRKTTRGNGMENLVSDTRHALRGLARTPAFTLMAVMTIALGLGANAAIFSVVNGVLIEPLPYEEPDELVRVWGRFLPESGFDFPYFSVDPTEYLDLREQSRALDVVAAYSPAGMALLGVDGIPERRAGLATTWNLFELLGVEARLGRTLMAVDDTEGGPAVVVISDRIWSTRFGADADILGTTVTLNREAYEVVGVLPPGFSFPGPDVDLYVPLQLGENPSNRMSHYLRVIGRRDDGVSMEAAESDLERMMGTWVSDYPEIHTGHFLFLEGFKASMVQSVRPALLLLSGAVGFVLLVACANVANLLMVRGHARAGEVAVRRALGASRWRLMQYGLVESVILALAGAVLGLVLAAVCTPLLVSMNVGAVPLSDRIEIDAAVLLFTASLALATAGLFGLVPSAQVLSQGTAGALREETRSASASRRRVRARNLLITAEVAMSFVLVIGAGLMIRSMSNLLAEDPGFETRARLVADFSLPSAAYPEAGSGADFLDEVVERATALPGVTSVTHVTHLLMRGGQSVTDFELEGMPEPGPGQPAWNAGVTTVRSNYFEVVGIEVQRGRTCDPSVDRVDGPLAVVVSRALADKFMPGVDPLGQRMRFSGSDRPWWTIVGVVDDVQYQALGGDSEPMYYVLTEQLPQIGATGWERFGTLVVEATTGSALDLAEPLRRIVAEVDPEVPLTNVATLETVVSGSVSRSRFLMTLLGAFAALALLLGSIGIYGVTSFVVSQKRHDIGVHKALGAAGEQVVTLVMRQGMVPIGAGIAVGLAGAFWAGRFLTALLYGVEPSDAVTYGAVLAVLGAVALVSLWLPARRAARLDPMIALRNE